MQIEIRQSFIKDLKPIPKNIKSKLGDIIDLIEQTESFSDLTSVKKMQGYQNFYRLRIGDYRLGFAVDGDSIILIRFLHRKKIYRFFP